MEGRSWWLSVGRCTVSNMTTTSNPTIDRAELILREAAVLVRAKWRKGTTKGRGYGIPEAVREAARGDRVPMVVAERQCQVKGLDVWWNDLIIADGEEAALDLEDIADIDPAVLYGEMWEANVGLLVLCGILTKDQLNALGNVMTRETSDLFVSCIEVAREHDRQNMLTWLCEDVHFSVGHYATTPAGTYRRLRGIRALECVAAHHMLCDVIGIDTAAALVKPVATILLPVDLHC